MSLRIYSLAAFPMLLFAQTPTNVPRAMGVSVAVPAASSYRIPNIRDSPFSAVAVEETDPQQPDGSPKVVKTIRVIARDFEGRTYVENHYPLTPSDTGHGRIRDVIVCDPLTHTRTELDPATMQATTFGLPVSTPATQTTAEGTEDLGMSIMEGLSVHGQRSSKTMVLKPPTIERETIGNGTEITVTNEAWYSDQLQMNVLTKTHVTGDPTRTLTVTQVSLNEPDATLFQIPSAYTQTNVQQAVRIGGKIAEANLITHVDPTYPSLAKAARVQGVVEFTATIGPDGVIKNLQLVRGHPLLVNAAKEAVLQWRYRPTFLNGEAISVTTPVIVSFTLPDQN